MKYSGQGGRSLNSKTSPKAIRRKKARIWTLQVVMVATLSTVVWRVYDVQHVYGRQLEKSANGVVDVTKPLLAPRGAILDAQGNELAYDVPAYYVDIQLQYLRQYATTAASILAPILGTSQSDLTKLLSEDEQKDEWIELPTPVQEPVQAKLQQAFATHAWAPGKSSIAWSNQITFSPTEQRVYPYGSFAANTIGYVSKGTGQSGVELEYNKVLSGTNGELTYKQDPTGVPLPGTVKVVKPSKPGDTVQLTIDDTIQGYVENQMDELIKEYHPEHAAIIVENPQTGAILAISSRPTFDPNEYWDASSTALSQNWAVSSAFEPGSTFKPFVLSAALATNSINLYATFQSGETVVDGQTIHDWLWGGWGTLTYQEALEKSSNVGFSKIALALGWPNMNKYLNLFGFTQPTGIDLPNEATSLLFPKSYQNSIELATTGFGQGIAVTPLQQVAAMGVIANGGKLMRPYIMQKVIAPNGKVVEQTSPKVVRQGFLPQNVIQEVSHTMVLDVSGPQGIDTGAAIKGYEIAGKTGTAQIVDPQTGQYYQNRFETSFIGFAPANDPKVLVYVTLYWPKTAPDEQWGSTVAIPPARAIIQDCLNYYHIPPTGAVSSLADETKGAGQVKYVETPSIVGMSSSEAEAKLQSLGLKATISGDGGVVTKQWPQPGIEVAEGSKMYGVLQSGTGSQIAVPNLQGLSLRDATDLLAALGLTIDPQGSGYVTSQSVAAGQTVSAGSTVRVTLQP
ncbi:penicillin-binding transpeptidase domain-containing protein [Alicyclobacillus acidiphilus]|uniref:penicillin-binding transpeptidase domain-containing protein n=1 Tax=Alicyclobacillus acidiphilus TaxID=182455 RepID=UPI000833F8EC|nr:penicillin-binding transpeptidase domain-containing protein [Alicyclobacillus acidiphilus]